MTARRKTKPQAKVIDLGAYARDRRAVQVRPLAEDEAVHEIDLLNEALTIKVICCYRYRQNYLDAMKANGFSAASEFLRHAQTEVRHAKQIAERIVELGGTPVYPSEDSLLPPEHISEHGGDLIAIIEENLIAKEIVIDTYLTLIDYIGLDDPVTAELLQGIVDEEESHIGSLESLREAMRHEVKATRRAHLRLCK